MRISDWSSDVCSSDLSSASPIQNLCSPKTPEWQPIVVCRLSCSAKPRRRRPTSSPDWTKPELLSSHFHTQDLSNPNRRSEERRVGKECVCVDLGGSRIIKKKNNNYRY